MVLSPGAVMDFPIRIRPLLTLLLWPFGARGPRAVVNLDAGRLRLQFGTLFDHSFALAQIEHVRPSSWPWWMGMGLRIGVDAKLGLIGSLRGVVCIHFREPVCVHALMSLSCRDLYVSLKDPAGFITASEAALQDVQARGE
jgi:hypothetical protein